MRESMALTQAQFAVVLGCSQSLVSKIEKGEMPPTLELYRRASIVGIDFADDDFWTIWAGYPMGNDLP
jgi:transcriptional regulator with XRE-family HTH domain